MKWILGVLILGWVTLYLSGAAVLIKQEKFYGDDKLSCTYFVGFEEMSIDFWLSTRKLCPRVMWVN